jgi:hypothetical protein
MFVKFVIGSILESFVVVVFLSFILCMFFIVYCGVCWSTSEW